MKPPRSRRRPPLAQPRPPRRRIMLWVALSLLAIGAVYTVWKDQQQDQSAPAKPLESWVQPGWRVVKFPDQPGPFEKLGESNIYKAGESGGFTYRTPSGLVTHRIISKPNVEQQVLLLKSESGDLTITVLER